MMPEIQINNLFTDEEIYAILKGLDMFIYENKYLSEEGYKAATSARSKIAEAVE